jgi:hypothetical protein
MRACWPGVEDLADGLPDIAAGSYSYPPSGSGPEEPEEPDGSSSRSRFVFFLFEVRALLGVRGLVGDLLPVTCDSNS